MPLIVENSSKPSGLVDHWKYRYEQANERARDLELYYAERLSEALRRIAELEQEVALLRNPLPAKSSDAQPTDSEGSG